MILTKPYRCVYRGDRATVCGKFDTKSRTVVGAGSQAVEYTSQRWFDNWLTEHSIDLSDVDYTRGQEPQE